MPRRWRELEFKVAGNALLCTAIVMSGLSCNRQMAPQPRSAAASETPSDDGAEAENRAAQSDVKSSSELREVDAIVVGAGISGLSAALELARGGAEVRLIEMSSMFGGHAVMSQGSVSIVQTPLQAELGQPDTPERAYKDFIEFGDDADTGWARYYVDHSREDIYDWLTELGVRFDRIASSPGNSVEREHQPVGRGIGLVTPIYRACLEQPNLQFVWNTKVEQLLVENGRVAGVVGRDLRTDTTERFAAKHVVLATGGFQSNLDMVREYWPAEFRFPERILVGSGRNSVGFGHKLAESAGGDFSKMDHQWNYYTGIPDPRYPGTNRGLSAANMYGIVVNAEGRRFADEWGWAKAVMPPLLKQEHATLWFVFDEASKPFFVVSGSDWADFKVVEREFINNPKFVQSADTLEELASKTGLPAANLVETFRRYNELVAKGVDEDFHRFGPERPAYANKASPPLVKPPFYAMQAFPLTRKSMGGVAIDLQCRVLDKEKQPIPGLYAVGELTGLGGINGKAALEGTFLGPCVVTGRMAARTVLSQLDSNRVKPSREQQSCTSCHDIAADLATSRPGYWHFESVHRRVLDRRTDCRHCHAELSPYREEQHRINPQALAASCVQCHLAQE